MTDYPTDPNQNPEYPQQYQQQCPQSQEPAPKKGGAGKWIAFAGVGCLLLLLLLGGAGYFFFTQLAKEEIEIVNQHLSAIQANDIDRAYSLCSSEFRSSTSREEFLNLVEQHPVLRNAKEFSSMNRSKEGGGTTVLKGTIEGKDGAKLPAEYQLIKEADGWRIQYIKLSPAGFAVEDSKAEQKTLEQKPSQAQSESSAPQAAVPSPSDLEIQNVTVEKTPEPDRIIVVIKFQVINFVNDKAQGTARIHLIQDLSTVDPQGMKLEDLSKEGIKELIESGEPEYTGADFTNTLTIPSSYPKGTYQAILTVHDKIGGGRTTGIAEFQIP
jgi:hypothetical protein